MTSVHDTCYAAMDPPLQRAYRRLACCPGPSFSAAAAAAVLQLGPPGTDAMLAALCEASLVTHRGGDRWELPGLVAQHARQMADLHDTPDERAAATARAALYYLHWTASLDRVIAPQRRRYAAVFAWTPAPPAEADDEPTAVRVLQERVDTVLAAQAAAADQGLHCVAWQYADTVWGYLIRRQDYRAGQQLCQVALDSAVRCGDLGAQARIHALAGALERRSGHLPQALNHHEHTARLARRLGEGLLEASAAEHHAATLLELDRPADALPILADGLTLYQAAPAADERGAMLLRRQLGIALDRVGRHDEADQHLAAVAAFFDDTGEPYLRSRVATNRAEAALRRGSATTALIHLDHAAAVCPDRAAPYDAYLHCLYAQAHLTAGGTATARQHRDRAQQPAAELPPRPSHPAGPGGTGRAAVEPRPLTGLRARQATPARPPAGPSAPDRPPLGGTAR